MTLPTDPDLKPLRNGWQRLESPWRVELAHQWVEIIPEGFASDGATIPAVFWPVLGPPVRGKYLYPAIVHDWLCTTAKTYTERVIADSAFYWLLGVWGVALWKRPILYVGVRLGGMWHWLRPGRNRASVSRPA